MKYLIYISIHTPESILCRGTFGIGYSAVKVCTYVSVYVPWDMCVSGIRCPTVFLGL